MYLIYILILIIVNIRIASAQQLKIELDGDAVFNSSGLLITEAGNDFPSSLKSDVPVLLSVKYTDSWQKMNNPNNKWNIQINKVDINWHPDIILEVRRSGNGYVPDSNSNPNIHDGDIFQNVTNTPGYFFRGRGEIIYVPLDIQLRGLSVSMGAQTFETKIIFTVYDEW